MTAPNANANTNANTNTPKITKKLELYVHASYSGLFWTLKLTDLESGRIIYHNSSSSKKAYELVALLLDVRFPFLEKRGDRYVYVYHRKRDTIENFVHVFDDSTLTQDMIDAIKLLMHIPLILTKRKEFEPQNRDDLMALLYVLKLGLTRK